MIPNKVGPAHSLRRAGNIARIGLLAMTAMALTPTGCSHQQIRTNISLHRLSADGLFITSSADGKQVTIGTGNQKINFSSSIEIKDKIPELIEIYKQVAELNSLIPSMPVQNVYMENNVFAFYYHAKPHTIVLNFYHNSPSIIAHEMGHAVFRVLLGGEIGTKDELVAVKDPLWQKIYYLSLKNENYNVVKDSNYAKTADPIIEASGRGHPWSNASELFASAFMVYTMYPDEFVNIILDPNTSKENREFGILVSLYLGDRIFTGNNILK